MSNTFSFSNNLKKWVLGLAVVGLVLGVVLGFFFDDTEHHSRLWANLLLNTYYFAGIAVTGVFFITAHQLGYGGWHTVFKKVPIAMGRFLYVAFPLFLIIVAGLWLAPEGLYSHWADPHHRDSIILGKAPFLTRKSFAVGVIVFYGLWALFAWLLKKNFISIKNWKEYSKAKKISAGFLLVFGVSSSILSWWVIMSLDPHWYSTLFGWYNLASYFCAGFAMMILIMLGLKKAGHLPHVTEDHIHDVAKLMFGFSVFWTYLMFSQFLLIWYANVPEATVWFNKRFDIPMFKAIFFLALIINFFLPVLAILKRDAKRNYWTVGTVSVLLIIGHYLDFYHMVMVEPMGIPHGDHHTDDHGDGHALLSAENVLYAEVDAEHADAHDEVLVEEAHEVLDAHMDEAHEGEADAHGDEMHADEHGDEAHAVVDAHADDSHGDEAHVDGAHGEDGHHGEGEVLTHAKLGLVEIFFFLGFLGLFLLMTFTGLDGEKIESDSDDDPFLEESKHHHVKYS